MGSWGVRLTWFDCNFYSDFLLMMRKSVDSSARAKRNLIAWKS